MQNHRPRKRFGQNFLQDETIIDHIVACINPQQNQNLVEIGPGLGALTRRILPLCQKLHVIELDRNLIPKLQDSCKNLGNLIIHNIDALDFNFASLKNHNKLRIFGNLPYNISTPLLFHLLDSYKMISDMHFMLQKEVAERIVAKTDCQEYGRLSVMIQYHCNTEILFEVPPEAFSPKPKVNSAFIKLTPHIQKAYEAKNLDSFKKIVKCAFTHRRKTLRNNLKPIFCEADFENLDIDPNLRPQNITIAEYVKLANF